MEIRHRLYPYPVLSPHSNDYSKGSFDAQISFSRDGYDCRVDFQAALESESLLECIRQGRAKYVYRIECSQTGFRKAFETDKACDKTYLSHKSVRGDVQVCPFIVASEYIRGYSSPDFHEDYQGASFDIEAGCVMAVGNAFKADILTDSDDLADAPSFFSISKNDDKSCCQMLVDMQRYKIVVKLPEDDFYRYKNLNANPLMQPLLRSLVIVPALVHVLDRLQLDEEREDYSESPWYKSLSKILLDRFGCDIEDGALKEQNSMELAQKLVGNPLSDALSFLARGDDAMEDDE